MPPAIHTLSIASDFAEVRRAAEWLDALALPGWADRRRSDLALAGVEALNNVVRHAYGEVAGRPIRLALTVSDARLELAIEDEGRPAADGIFAEQRRPVDDLSEHGRGLLIIRGCADGLAYCSGQSFNRLTLIFMPSRS